MPVGKACQDFKGAIKLNATAKFIWEAFIAGDSEDEIVAKLVDKYEVTENHARSSCRTVAERMVEIGAMIINGAD